MDIYSKEFLESGGQSPLSGSLPVRFHGYLYESRYDADSCVCSDIVAGVSGSYNSAVLGVELYKEEYGEKKIHVFNSKSASIGETLIAMKIAECEDKGMTFGEVIDTVETYIEINRTHFLRIAKALRKNGRLTGLKAMVATALSIKPVMGATPEGTICPFGTGSKGKKESLK